MLIFAVESSCDETAVAVYSSAAGILAHRLYSQLSIHSQHRGVVPELAARSHTEKLTPLTELCLKAAQVSPHDLDAIAYTQGPGLIPCLMAGAAYARALAYSLKLPALGVHHLEGHLLSPLLAANPPSFPYIALLVSGGHTQLYLIKGYGNYQLYGESVDDAAGEAFDKSAVLLGLAYPGGAELEKLAKAGQPQRFKFTMPMAHSGDYNFSFSGIKTQVRYLIEKLEAQQLKDYHADLAAAFQQTVVQGLLAKTFALAQETATTNLVIVGGVSANQYFRHCALERAKQLKLSMHFAPLEYCTDNAAMIAVAAAYRLAAGQQDSLAIKAQARLAIPS